MSTVSSQEFARSGQGAQQVRQVCSELFHSTDISFFSYSRFDKDRNFQFTLSDPRFIDFYLKGKHYLTEFAHRDFNDFKSGNYFVRLIAGTDPEVQLWNEVLNHFQLDNFLTIWKNDGDECELYTFAGISDELQNFYINNMGLLENFTTIAKDPMRNILKSNAISKFSVPLLNKQQETSELQEYRVDNKLAILTNVLSSGKALGSSNYQAKISQREVECLQLILQGLTAKEIARQLQLSFRTVENYCASLRLKLDCPRRHDLVARFAGCLSN